MMPLVFGAQRFSTSSGMACKQSELSTGVADSMAWSSGELGLISEAGAAAASESVQAAGRRLRRLVRRLSAADGAADEAADGAADEAAEPLVATVAPFPTEMIKLLDQLSMFGIAFGLCAFLQLLGLLCWRYRCNRKYYRALRKLNRKLEAEAEAERKRQKALQPVTKWARGLPLLGWWRRKPKVAPQPLGTPCHSRVEDYLFPSADGHPPPGHPPPGHPPPGHPPPGHPPPGHPPPGHPPPGPPPPGEGPR